MHFVQSYPLVFTNNFISGQNRDKMQIPLTGPFHSQHISVLKPTGFKQPGNSYHQKRGMDFKGLWHASKYFPVIVGLIFATFIATNNLTEYPYHISTFTFVALSILLLLYE